jgi:hypothetical protein
VAVIPAALCASDLLRSCDPRLAVFRAVVTAVLMVGALNTILLFGNNSRAPYEVLSSDGRALVEWIRANTPANSRVMFAGSTVHGYEGGHVAFMQYLTGREMMACDYYHFSPEVVDYDYPPRPWRNNPEFFSRFLELYNVSVITTLRNKWKNYLRSRPEEYREEISFGEEVSPGEGKPLVFFRVIKPSKSPSFANKASEGSAKASLFLAGHGRVQAHFNRLEVELEKSDEEAVIKYNWQPGLSCAKPAEIFPYHAGAGVILIGIHPHGEKHVVIRYIS